MIHSGRTAIPGRGVRLGTIILSVCACLAGACRTPDVREELSQSGFRSPEQTFETFRAAFVSDLESVEFDCLSASFRRGYGVSEFNYREGREIWLGSQPFLRWGIGRAKIRSVERTRPDRARLVARSESWFHEVDFEILLVREDFYELYVDGERVDDDYLAWESSFRSRQTNDGTWWVDGVFALQNPDLIENPERIDEITELRVGREWKIDGFRQLDSED